MSLTSMTYLNERERIIIIIIIIIIERERERETAAFRIKTRPTDTWCCRNSLQIPANEL